eukprot:jgi/Botrbrau1/5499/Bobra.27_1s0036.1
MLASQGVLPDRARFSARLTNFGDQHLEYPSRAEDYQLLDQIGSGATAEVFRAKCIPFNSQVAIKLINLDRVTTGLDLILSEAKVMRDLKHPNVLELYAAFVNDSALWMVMPFISGGPLSSIVQRRFPRGMDEVTIATIARDVLRGLEYLHKHDRMHRDLKASNLLLDHLGQVLLADFGVTAELEREMPFVSELSPVVETVEHAFDMESNGSPDSSQPGSDCSAKAGSLSTIRGSCSNVASYLSRKTYCGTMHFMAPEIVGLDEEGYSQSADIWSFGITLLELAHGKPPLADAKLRELACNIIHSESPKLEDGASAFSFSDAAKDFVAKCLVKDPLLRPTAETLLQHRFLRQARDSDYLAGRLLLVADPIPGQPDSPFISLSPTSPMVSETELRGTQSQLVGSAKVSSELQSCYSEMSVKGRAFGGKKRKCNTLEWRFEFNGAGYVLLAQILHNHSSAALYLNRKQILYRKYSFWEQLTWQGDEFVLTVPEIFGPLSGRTLKVRLTCVTVLEGVAQRDDITLSVPRALTRHMQEPLPIRDSKETLQVLSPSFSDPLKIASSFSSGTAGSEDRSPYSNSSGTSASTVFGIPKQIQVPTLSGSPKPPMSPYELMAGNSWSWDGDAQSGKPSSGPESPEPLLLLGEVDPRRQSLGDPQHLSSGSANGGRSSLGRSSLTERSSNSPQGNMNQPASQGKSVMGKPPSFPKDRTKSSGSLTAFLGWNSRRHSLDSEARSSARQLFGSRKPSKLPIILSGGDHADAHNSFTDVQRSVFSAPSLN